MVNKNQYGFGSLVLVTILLGLLLVGAAGFGFWAYSERSDYKNNVDKKISEALASAEDSQRAELQKQFNEKAKSPYKTYESPPNFGTITFDYPKIWSVYIDQSSKSIPLNGYFHPEIVPGIQSTTALALRVEVVPSTYDTVLKQYADEIKNGKIRASATVPPKMEGIENVQPGTRLQGEIVSKKQGTMVIVKIRDKTLKISTQSAEFLKDFDSIVLASLTFSP